MDNLIFFNPGDSIGNFHDYDEAVRTAQIYRDKNQVQEGHVLVVKGVDNHDFDIFLADNEVTHNNEKDAGQAYHVSKEV
ncbi:hypothetical protein GPK34_04945 [Secundilactobacillus kimchicus]|uniref:Uncharacterized protein n=1 Tax=Secundilactobacillus kimchicus JCM 15530 TaxID=1302272 RepID=A0A0R1HZP0_9LACO|nr:hypothetical protein [Secundilactobacillus kimchicus]KRK49137.1 hypothetical protein FC96_GL000054 [Secundilactobacillus kimchicus JCM 15530]MBT9671381.1 hypothetical protein [Secundilactobacillus kimchicus]